MVNFSKRYLLLALYHSNKIESKCIKKYKQNAIYKLQILFKDGMR